MCFYILTIKGGVISERISISKKCAKSLYTIHIKIHSILE